MPSGAVTTCAIAWIRSRHLHIAAAACLLVAVIGAAAGDATLELPLLRRSLPLPVIVILIPSLVMTGPLCDRLGGLEATLPRAATDRAAAGSAACGLAAAACLPPGLAMGTQFPWSPLLTLMAVAVLAVVLLGELAWLPTTALALTTIYIDFVYQEPIKTELDAIGLVPIVAALAACMLAFVAYGPRRS